MTKVLTPAVIVAAAIALLATVILLKPMFPVQGAAIFAPNFSNATTSTAVNVSGTSIRILATTTNPLDPTNSYTRDYATICNPSATIVYLRLAGDKPVVTGQGTYMIGAAAGYNACYVLDTLSYSGSIQASSTAGTVSVSVTEFTH